ncbi:hypothetical protein MBANPS3_002882 [Mucor bainieri]
MPTTDFYTRYFLTAMTILWASTFSLCVLFFPKLLKILFSKKALLVSPTTEKRDDRDDEKTLYDENQILTMNRMIATSTHILVDEVDEGKKTEGPIKWSSSMHPTMMDTYQGNQNAPKEPILFCYSHASIISNVPGNYVFKVHGATGGGHCDLLIQVSDQKQLSRWLGLFDRKLARHDGNKRGDRPLSLSVDHAHDDSSIAGGSSKNSSNSRSICDAAYASQFTICSDETSLSSVVQAHCK